MAKAGKSGADSLDRGIELAQKGHDSEAEAAFREAIKAEPDSVEAHLNLGVVMERQGRHTEAEQVFRRATELWPDSAEARFDLGVALECTALCSPSGADVHRYGEAIIHGVTGANRTGPVNCILASVDSYLGKALY